MNVRPLIVTVWILLLIIGTSQFVVLAANMGLLVWAAPLLPVIPIAGLYRLRPAEEKAGWAVFTVWLGSTYLSTGLTLEYAAFAVVAVLALAGYFANVWFLVAAWFAHIAWDFVPRELPELLHDLPLACLIFDGLIGAFIAWRHLQGRWAANMEADAHAGRA